MGLARREVKQKRLRAWSQFLGDRTEKTQVELIEVYRPMVEWMAWKDYGWRGDLEDIKATGMLGVFEATQKIDVKRVKSVDAYVSMLARSRMINYVQKMWNRDETLPDVVLQEKFEMAIESDFDLSIDIEEAMMKHLSSKERLVLKLRFWGGWQQTEIAELLKCTKPNVWYIEKQALAKIKHDCYTPL